MARRRGLSYRQQQTVSLLIIAVVPVVLVSAIVLGQVDAAIRADADARTADAGRAVQSILVSNGAALDRLAQSYASWSVLQRYVANLQDQDIAQTVVDYQVAQGAVDDAVVLVGTHAVAAGTGATALERILARALGPGGTLPGTTYADLPGGVYQVSLQAIDLSGLSGPGVVEGNGRAGLAFAQRLGSDFVVQATRLTGFDVAVYDASGTLATTSNQAIGQQLAPGTGWLPPAGVGLVARRLPGNVVAAALPLQGPAADGSTGAVGTVVVATQLGLASTIGANLVPFLAVLLALVLVFAASLAVYLAGLLRRRLGEVEAGLTAVAAGDLGARLRAGDRDEIDRLAASHNRLAAALEQRDRVVWRSLEALEGLRPDRGPRALLGDVLDAALAIFDLEACWLRDGTGAVTASAPPGAAVPDVPAPEGQAPDGEPLDPRASAGGALDGGATDDGPGPGPADPSIVSADVDAIPGSRLEGRGPGVAAWTVADRALFGLFAREAGVALRSAGLHEEASRRAERLGRANEIQREFVRGVGHNLQGPLSRVLMASEDLASSLPPDDERRREVEAIHADAARLGRVVRELLTATRLDAGVFVPAQEPFAIGPAIRRAWHAVSSDRPLDLDDRSAGWLAVGDRDAIEQVAWILLDNAVRYAPSGPIHVSVAPDGSRALLVRVRDEGPGVPRGERTLIFRRFRRGSTAHGHDGTGLGLDVARRLVRAMGGQLGYEDAPEGGATFAFTVPAEPNRGPE